MEGFIRLPPSIQTYFLDTNVWGKLASSDNLAGKFSSWFQSENLLACLTQYTIMELTRAKALIEKLDSLFLNTRHHIWIPLLYDQLFDRELRNYPKRPEILWMPLSMVTNEENPKLMSRFSEDPRIVETRDEHLEFGFSSFMDLEQFKVNFQPDGDGSYNSRQAFEFARQNGVDYFRRHMEDQNRRFLNREGRFLPNGLSSQFLRSLFVFYRYYIHGQSPGRSDFLDFANLSYAPYVNSYITEREVLNVLRHIKSTGLALARCEVIHISDFLAAVERFDGDLSAA